MSNKLPHLGSPSNQSSSLAGLFLADAPIVESSRSTLLVSDGLMTSAKNLEESGTTLDTSVLSSTAEVGWCIPAPPIIMSIISWNCGEFGNRRTILSETKLMSSQFDKLKQKLCMFGVDVAVKGKSGGLAMLYMEERCRV